MSEVFDATRIYTGRAPKMDPYSTLSDRAKELIAEVHAEQAQVRAMQVALDDECRKQIAAWEFRRILDGAGAGEGA